MKNQFKTMAMATLLLVAANKLQAQTIPNAGFETWTNTGTYSDPDGWSTMNAITNSMSLLTAVKGTPGATGTGFLKLTSKSVGSLGVVNGIATSGELNRTTMQPKSGFAYNARPTALTGKWQHMIYGSSQGFINIQLTRWDANMNMRMPVATGNVTLSGMAMSWASFSIPLTYVDNAMPDSCMITMAASGTNPTANDYLWVDDLVFTNSTSVINSDKNNMFDIAVSPNPASTVWNITAQNVNDKMAVKLINILGEEIAIETPVFDGNKAYLTIANSNLASGIYFLRITNAITTKTIQLIKN